MNKKKLPKHNICERKYMEIQQKNFKTFLNIEMKTLQKRLKPTKLYFKS